MDLQTPPISGTKRTASGTSKTSVSSASKQLKLRELLKISDMPIGDVKAKREYPEVLELAKELVKGDRHSAMKADSVERLGKNLEKYGKRNEDTFLRKVWSKLIKEDREVQDNDTDLIWETWEKKAWEVDNLDDNWNKEFQKGSIPLVDTSRNKPMARLLNSCDRIKNPKPDVVYGLDELAFTEDEMVINHLFLSEAGISRGIWHPGLIVEAKTAGIIELVECQCARGGAALVNATRGLLKASGASIDTPGADLKSYVFSIALVPSCANLFIHWAEVIKDGQTRFHMHLVGTYALLDDEQLKKLRHDINNVLDWISLTRKDWLKKLLAAIRTKIESEGGPIAPAVVDDNSEDGEGASSVKTVSLEDDEVEVDTEVVLRRVVLRRSKRQRTKKVFTD